MATDTEVSAVSAQIPTYVAGKNAVINGGFDFWQRGTSFASTGGSYTADRWWSAASGSGSTTISRQAPGSTLPQFQYALRTQRNSGSTETTSQQLGYTLETADSLRFAGQTITVSFYARVGANYSPSGSGLFFLLNTGTGTDQRLLGAGFTGNANILFTSATLSTSWQRFSYQVAIGSTATGIGFYWQANVAGTAGVNDWFEITGVQLEVGSAATPFSRAGGDLQGELAKCLRYYEKNYIDSVTPGSNINPASSGMIEQQALILSSPVGSTPGSTRSRSFPQSFKVQKRVSPSIRIWDLAGNINKYTSGDNNGSFSANNNSLDVFGGAQATQNSITWQTSLASSSHVYAGIMWDVSSEL
jgi:hypothetical protein